METLIGYDQELFLFLNGLGNTTWDPIWLFITNKLSSIPLYAVLLFLMFKKYGAKGTLLTVLVVAVLITATDQISYLFKHSVMRPRPCQEEAFKASMRFIAERCGRYGYFSGHATSSMAIAVFAGLTLQSRYRFLVFGLLFWAAVIGYSRIYLGVHYPGDVLSGMIVGSILGFSAYKLQQYVLKKYKLSVTH
ncbi:phosphatase PAP2 family protein [Dokdonia sinensis]|uniref:Phosphatase PAP2 family protein n=1 Tax=Dokdonia sinensis TaxID=2479847 RepID=A0A3M0G6N7_9FLAO|nr:phosphatase PAP2 family protein [Dokdonia sinensis]RMB60595.1 phosphatase PAP2 family protein [Dokdonia sinensis]